MGDWMRLDQLKQLVEIEKLGSISKVAEKNFLTQQAVSINLKKLEKELGCDLLIRSPKGIMFTKEGELTVNCAAQILQQWSTLIDTIEQMRKEKIAEEEISLKICSISTVTNIVLPKIISEINETHQNISIKINILNNLDEVVHAVKNEEADIGLISFNEQGIFQNIEISEQDLQLDVLAHDELIVVVNKKHYNGEYNYIQAQDYMHPKQLRTIYDVTPIHDMQQEMHACNMVASNDIEFHRNMLEQVGAMVMMSKLAYRFFFNSKKFVALPLENVHTPLIHAVIYRKNSSQLVQEFTQKIRKQMNKYISV